MTLKRVEKFYPNEEWENSSAKSNQMEERKPKRNIMRRKRVEKPKKGGRKRDVGKKKKGESECVWPHTLPLRGGKEWVKRPENKGKPGERREARRSASQRDLRIVPDASIVSYALPIPGSRHWV